MTDTAARLAGIRGRLNALHVNIQELGDLKQAARGLELQALDLEASYYTSPGSGGRTSEISDPTHTAATRRRPTAPPVTLHDAQKALDVLYMYVGHLRAMHRLGDPVGRNRPEGGSPCLGATLHQPDDAGRCTAAGCDTRWPVCTPDSVPRWEDCSGTVLHGATRCTRCELSLGNTVCRSCGEVKTAGRPTMQTSRECKACYQAERRRPQSEACSHAGDCVPTESDLD